MWNIRKITNIPDGSVFNEAYTKQSSFIYKFCLYIYSGVAAKRFKKEKQPFNNKSVKVTADGNHEFPRTARQVELLGKEITTWGFNPLGKIIPGSLIEWKLPNKLFMDFTISELYKRDSIS